MKKPDIVVTIYEKEWKAFFRKIYFEPEITKTFKQKITRLYNEDGDYFDVWTVITLIKKSDTKWQMKFVFGFSDEVFKSEKMRIRWKKFLKNFLKEKMENPIFGERFSDELVSKECGVLYVDFFKEGTELKIIDIFKNHVKNIFKIFYHHFFENVVDEEILILIDYPTVKDTSWEYKFFPKEWDKSDLPYWLQEVDEKKITHIQNNLLDFNPNDIILSKSVQNDLDFIVKQYQNREHFQKFSAALARGIVLYWPPGTGKTTIAKILAHRLKMPFHFISSSEIISKWVGESAERMHQFFEKVEENSLVFVDEIDGLLPERKYENYSGADQERNNVVNVFLEYMDGMKSLKNVIFVGATNHVESLDKSVLRAGRFDKKIFVSPPDKEARVKLWKKYLEKTNENSVLNILDESTDFEILANNTANFTGADIKEIIRRIMNDLAIFSLNSKKDIEITPEKFFKGILTHIEKYKEESSLDKGILPEKEKFFLSDIGGQSELKSEIKKLVTQIKNREFFREMNVDLPKGMLLYWPPGTGKTLAAKVIASEAGILFYMMLAKDFLWRNGIEDLEKKLGNLQTPSIVFIDEIDAIAMHRRNMNQYSVQVLNTLLQKMDGFNSSEGIFFIGATNNLDEIDEALLRAGRFDIKLKIDKPDDEGRAEIFKICIQKSTTRSGISNFEENIDYKKLSEKTDGLVGADIKEIIRRLTQKFAISLLENNEEIGSRKITEDELLIEIQEYMENIVVDRRIGFVY